MSRISLSRRFISSKSSFISAPGEDDSPLLAFPPLLLPSGQGNSISCSSSSTLVGLLKLTIRVSEVDVSESIEDEVLNRFDLRLLRDVMVGTLGHLELPLRTSQRFMYVNVPCVELYSSNAFF
ncbi:hypothetical protein HanIR_Chr15g0746691 [Helianthus annuus]|nr:hypothetical protein HanIR_Chr15g0746691 [Helianthus annuus]